MTEPLNQHQLDELIICLKGNKEAIKYVLDILYTGHLIDDLFDQDKERTKEEVNDAFRKTLGEINVNPFYQVWHLQLAPLQLSAMILWEDSTKLEKGDLEQKMAAFVMRNAIANIAHYAVYLVGGVEWGKEYGSRLWQIFSLYSKWQEFKQEN